MRSRCCSVTMSALWLVPLAIASVGAASRSAQDPARNASSMFLVPRSFTATVGGVSAVGVERSASPRESREGAPVAGDAEPPPLFEPAAWPLDDVKWFHVRASGVQSNFDEVNAGAEIGAPCAVVIEKPGDTVVGLDVRPREIEFDAHALAAFLAERGFDTDALTDGVADDESILVRREESAKTIIRAGGEEGGVGSAVALHRSGQQAELRLLIDPMGVTRDGEFAFRAYIDIADRTRLRARATNADTFETVDATVNADGIVRFPRGAGGRWFIEVHSFEPIERTPEGDRAAREGDPPRWRWITATVTFAVPGIEEDGR
jgi:hypothetical protein